MSDNTLDGENFEKRTEPYLNQYFWDKINNIRQRIGNTDAITQMRNRLLQVTAYLSTAMNILVPTEDKTGLIEPIEKANELVRQVGELPTQNFDPAQLILELKAITVELQTALNSQKIRNEHPDEIGGGPWVTFTNLRSAIGILENPLFNSRYDNPPPRPDNFPNVL